MTVGSPQSAEGGHTSEPLGPERPRPPQRLPRRRFHRWTFGLAAAYNVAWGIYSALDPQWLFRVTDMPPMRHPTIFACLAMVIGLYGVLYADVARRPERGFSIAAVGLAGKVLGPLGLAVLVAQGTWPPRSVVLVLTNDLLWWGPFGLYCYDAWPFFQRELEVPHPSA